MPITAPITYQVKDLPPLNDPKQLFGKRIEAEDITTGESSSFTVSVLVQAVANSLPAPTKPTYLVARTYDATDPNYLPGYATLVSESLRCTLVMWMTAYVEFPYPSKQYRLEYDPTGQYQAYADTSYSGGTNPAKWVEITAASNAVRGLPDFSPLTAKYAQGDAVKYRLGGVYRIFAASQDLLAGAFSGQLPAPTGLATDPYWTEVNGEAAPNYSREGQLACRYYTNAERAADPYPVGDTVEDLVARENAGAGILYTNRTVTVELGPNAGTYRVVFAASDSEFLAYIDGSFASGQNPSKWELVPSATLDDSNYAQLDRSNEFQGTLAVRLPGSSYESTLFSDTLSISGPGGIYGLVRLRSILGPDGSLIEAALQLDAAHAQVLHDPTLPNDIATKAYVDAQAAPGSDVDKAYVDAADAALSARVEAANTSAAHANDRLNTLVDNAPQALDTLKEIGDQLAADEQGTAAILATQQQHTQQLADVLTLSTAQTATGAKTFTQPLTIGTTSGSNSLNVWSNSSDTNVFIASLLAPNVRDNVFLTIGSQAGSNGQSALFGFSRENGIPAAFFTNYGRPASDFKILGTNGNIGMGTTSPSERLEVVGNVKAVKFIGDGSQLTNLPTTPVEQNLTSNSTTAAPSVAAVVASYRNNLTAATRDANQALDARQGKVLDDKITGVNNRIRTTTVVTDPFAQTTFEQGNFYVYNDILWLRTGATVSDNASSVLYVGSAGWQDTLGYSIYDGLISYGDRSLSNDSRWVKYQVGVSNQRAIKGQIWYLNGNAYRYINSASSTGVAQTISGPDEFATQTLWENVIGGGVVPQNLKNIVRNGTFTNGELQGPQPQNSIINAKFTDANYKYEYTYAAADTNGTQFVWVRTIKG